MSKQAVAFLSALFAVVASAQGQEPAVAPEVQPVLVEGGEEIPSGYELRFLAGHSGPVLSVSFSPDGSNLASGSFDNSVKLWDIASGRELRTLAGHSGPVLSVSFSPDGSTLASGSSDNFVKLWDIASGREPRTLAGHSGEVTSVSFSPDGSTLASGSNDNSLKLWDVASGRELRTFTGHSGDVNSVRFSPDGSTLASGSNDNSLRLWDVASGHELRTLAGHSGVTNSVTFSPDGSTLASGSNDNSVKLWDVTSGRELYTLTGHSGGVDSVSFSPDGSTLASGSYDNSVKLWDVTSGRELRTLADYSGPILSVSFSPDGGTLGSGSLGTSVKLWDVASEGELHPFASHSSAVVSVSFSPDGSILASGSIDKLVKLWGVASGREPLTLVGHSSVVVSVSFSPDGSTLASGSDDHSVKLWDVASGRELRTLAGHSQYVTSVSFSPDGRTLASGSGDRALKLWDVASGRELRTLAGHSGEVNSVSFSPDGSTLASGSADNSVKLWDVASGRELHTLAGHSGIVSSVCFSPDGSNLASGSFDSSVKLWDVASGRELRTLTGHSGVVFSVSFSPDGGNLASGSFDNSVKLWDVARGDLPWQLRGLGGGGWIAWSQDGRLYRADDGRTVLFRMSPNDNFEPLPPPPQPAPPVLTLTPPGATKLPSSTSDGVEPLASLTVTNSGNVPAYWIHARLADDAPSGFVAAAHRWRSRLDPEEALEIPISISYLHRLDRDDPQPPRAFETTLPFIVTAAHIEPLSFEIPVRVTAPLPEVDSLNVLTDPSTGEPSAVQLTLANRGDQDTGGLQVELDFVEPEDEMSGAERYDLYLGRRRSETASNEKPTIISLQPGTPSEPLSFTIPESLRDRIDQLEARVLVSSDVWPSHRWILRAPLEAGVSWPTYLAFAALGLFALTAAYVQLVMRNPAAVAVSSEPALLRSQPLRDLPRLDRILKAGFRLKDLLSTLEIPAGSWARALRGADDPTTNLADALHADVGEPEPVTDGVDFRRFKLPHLPLPIETQTGLITVSSTAPPNLDAELRRLVAEHGLAGAYLLVLDRTADQDVARRLADSFLRVTVLDERRLTGVLLAPDPVAELCRQVAENADLGDVSPYKTGGGVEDPAMFYGRRNELALLTGREARNHLLIGARQMGKTSVLKRLASRYPGRAHFLTLRGGDLDADLEKEGLPPLAELGKNGDGDAPELFLFDEADLLVAADREHGYPLCRELRAISQDRGCRFVLAGFWQLHHAAYLEHQSPIRNFAEPLRLGPLDAKAARALATQPLTLLGIRFDDDALIAELLERTGRRPNLIARACDAALRQLDPVGPRRIDAELLRAVLDVGDETGAQMAQAFGDLNTLTSDRRACHVDRMVLYAGVERDDFSLSDVAAALERHGATVPAVEVRESFERLTLAYVFEKQRGRYVYPVPLVRDYLRVEADGKPDEMLAAEARDWRQA